MIVYLHGFRSSPSSRKATLLREAVAARGHCAEFACPALPPSPRAAIEIDCVDCNGAIDRRPTLITRGPAAPEGGTALAALRTPWWQ